MFVPVMRVREMMVRMNDRLVPVSVSMPSARRDGRIMLMLVVGVTVMDMLMIVFQRLMNMLMVVPFAQVQPHAGSHQCSGNQQLRRDGIAKCQCEQRAEERRHREIGASASGTKIA